MNKVKYNKWNIAITTIVIFMIISFTIIALLWVKVLKKSTVVPIPSGFTTSDIGMKCISEDDNQISILSGIPTNYPPQKCKDGLTCYKGGQDILYGVCLKEIGTECKSLRECTPDAKYCNGICSRTSNGGIGQSCSVDRDECPNVGNTCSILEGQFYGECKTSYGNECFSDKNCLLGYCDIPDGQDETNTSKVCIPRGVNGDPCVIDNECLDRNCIVDDKDNNSYCQPSNAKSGEIGYYCKVNLGEDGPKCNETDILGKYLACGYEDVKDEYGTCEDALINWPSNGCNKDTPCITPSICVNGECILPIDDPNSCDGIGDVNSCIDGYGCVDGLCVAEEKGIPSDNSTTYGFSTWYKDKNIQTIGKWIENGEAKNFAPNTTPRESELFTLDYKLGSLNFIGGKIGINIQLSTPKSIMKMYRITNNNTEEVDIKLNYRLVDNNDNTIDNPYHYNDNNGLNITDNREFHIRVVSCRLLYSNQLLFFFNIFYFREEDNEALDVYYRPYVYDLDDDFYTQGISSIVIDVNNIVREWNIFNKVYIGPVIKKIIFNGYVYRDIQLDIWGDTRIVSDEKSIILSIKKPTYFDYYISTIDNINGLGTPDNDNNINLYNHNYNANNNILYPYISTKSTEKFTDIIEEAKFYIKNVINIGNGDISISNKEIADIRIIQSDGSIFTYSINYNVGGLLQQINIALVRNGRVNYYNSGLLNTMPGYFTNFTLVSLSSRYVGNNSDYIISESNWLSSLKVLTLVKE